jgi:hypothetical protein
MAPSRARLEVFAQALAAGNTPVQAARIAKYPAGTSFASNARKRAWRQDVKTRVTELQKPALEKVAAAIEANFAWATAYLTDVVERAKTSGVKTEHGIRATEVLGKMHGWMAPEKTELSGPDGKPIERIEYVIVEHPADRDSAGLPPTP